jgi:hypothetical protein
MIEIDAPIVPGKSAAGVSLGAFVGESLAADRPQSTIISEFVPIIKLREDKVQLT